MKQILSLFCFLLITGAISAQTFKEKTYLIVQGGLTRYRSSISDKSRAAASLGLGGIVENIFGAGVNVQYQKFKNSEVPLIPVCGEVSFQPDWFKIAPYASVQLGKGIYSEGQDLIFESGRGRIQTTGGLYFSPNVGVLIPVRNRTKLVLSAGYIYWRSTSRLTESIPSNILVTERRINSRGFNLMAGLRI